MLHVNLYHNSWEPGWAWNCWPRDYFSKDLIQSCRIIRVNVVVYMMCPPLLIRSATINVYGHWPQISLKSRRKANHSREFNSAFPSLMEGFPVQNNWIASFCKRQISKSIYIICIVQDWLYNIMYQISCESNTEIIIGEDEYRVCFMLFLP